MSKYTALRAIGTALLIVLSTEGVAQSTDAALTARMTKEKEARRACKIEICKAFARPAAGAPIGCHVTKTWLREEILARVTGGSYVWGYGNVQCSLKLDLDRGEIGKAFKGGGAELSFTEHRLTCNVESKDSSKGTGFSVKVALSPKIVFKDGKVTTVTMEPVKTEGSSLASAAVMSLMAVDKVSGAVSSAAAKEINEFLFSKCSVDGVKIEPRT